MYERTPTYEITNLQEKVMHKLVVKDFNKSKVGMAIKDESY